MSTGQLGSSAVAELARSLHQMGPAGRKELRRTFDTAAQPAAAAARSKARWSSRIPAAIGVRTTASEATAKYGVELRASATAAPHARAYEGIGGAANFAHPVFGRSTRWVPQKVRPYLLPAVQAQAAIVQRSCAAAYESAARQCGFR